MATSENELRSAKGSAAVHDDVRRIAEILARGTPPLCVGLIGSRACGDAHPYSDWDLAITGGAAPVSFDTYLDFRRRLDELSEDLPWSVQVVNLDAAPSWFLTAMDYEPVFVAGDVSSWQAFVQRLTDVRESSEQAA